MAHAMRKGFTEDIVQAATLQELQTMIYGLSVGASHREVSDDLVAADLSWLGKQPLGSSFTVPGKREVTCSERSEMG